MRRKRKIKATVHEKLRYGGKPRINATIRGLVDRNREERRVKIKTTNRLAFLRFTKVRPHICRCAAFRERLL